MKVLVTDNNIGYTRAHGTTPRDYVNSIMRDALIKKSNFLGDEQFSIFSDFMDAVKSALPETHGVINTCVVNAIKNDSSSIGSYPVADVEGKLPLAYLVTESDGTKSFEVVFQEKTFGNEPHTRAYKLRNISDQVTVDVKTTK